VAVTHSRWRDVSRHLREGRLRRLLALLIIYQAIAQGGAILAFMSVVPVHTRERILVCVGIFVLVLSVVELTLLQSRPEVPLRRQPMLLTTIVIIALGVNILSAFLLSRRTFFLPNRDLFTICLITTIAVIAAVYGTRMGLLFFFFAAMLFVAMGLINGYSLSSINGAQWSARVVWVSLGLFAAYGIMRITDELEAVTHSVGERTGELVAMDKMHDRALQDLKTIIMVTQSSGEASARLASIGTVARKLDDYIRRWHDYGLHDTPGGLHEGLADIARQAIESSPIDFSVVTAHPEHVPLPQAELAAVLEATRLAVHNIVQHSRAARGTLRCVEAEGALSVSIYDDGIGFVLEPRSGLGQGFGLTQICRAVERLGGTAILNTGPGLGTRWDVVVPLPVQDVVSNTDKTRQEANDASPGR
jgi:signal transduction histidine kinase